MGSEMCIRDRNQLVARRGHLVNESACATDERDHVTRRQDSALTAHQSRGPGYHAAAQTVEDTECDADCAGTCETPPTDQAFRDEPECGGNEMMPHWT